MQLQHKLVDIDTKTVIALSALEPFEADILNDTLRNKGINERWIPDLDFFDTVQQANKV